MLAKIENGVVTQWPLGEHYIQTEYPNTSFAFPLSDETLQQFGFARFKYSDPTEYNSVFQEPRELTPVLNNGVAVQAWEIVEKYSAEEKAVKIAEIETAKNAAKCNVIRTQRDEKLKDSDWTQVSDAPVNKEVWATYRQALRDITKQSGFPWEITWPVQPTQE